MTNIVPPLTIKLQIFCNLIVDCSIVCGMGSVEFIKFKKLLQKNHRFVTTPRMHLFGLLQNHPALSLKELISLVKKHDQVTVYRNVDLFEKLGIINLVRLGWSTKIELSDMFQHHNHHLTCLNCGKVIVLKDNPIIEKEIKNLSRSTDFRPTDHQLEIRGFCSSCQSSRTQL